MLYPGSVVPLAMFHQNPLQQWDFNLLRTCRHFLEQLRILSILHRESLKNSLEDKHIAKLSSHLPCGKLLRQIGLSLVIGKANCGAWVTREVRLSDEDRRSQQHPGQVAINDLARILTGHKRKDRVPVSVLADKANLPTINEIVVKRSATEAWKAMNGGALQNSLVVPSSSSRAASNKFVRPATNSIADTNLSKCWNRSQELREARNLNTAKKAAKKLASECRNF